MDCLSVAHALTINFPTNHHLLWAGLHVSNASRDGRVRDGCGHEGRRTWPGRRMAPPTGRLATGTSAARRLAAEIQDHAQKALGEENPNLLYISIFGVSIFGL